MKYLAEKLAVEIQKIDRYMFFFNFFFDESVPAETFSRKFLNDKN
jgi:hypothetical protein